MSIRERVMESKFGWLRERLEKLAPTSRAVFAAACTQRLMPSYQRLAAKMESLKSFDLDGTLRELWLDLSGVGTMSPAAQGRGMRICLEALEVMGTEVSTYISWPDEYAPGECAAAALVYTLRCRHSGEVQEAVWVAARTQEALYTYVKAQPINGREAPDVLDDALSHPLILAERDREIRDLKDLQENSIPIGQLRDRALKESADFLPELKQ